MSDSTKAEPTTTKRKPAMLKTDIANAGLPLRPRRFIREPERFAQTGVPKTTWADWDRAGYVPKRHKLHNIAFWYSDEIADWMEKVAAELEAS